MPVKLQDLRGVKVVANFTPLHRLASEDQMSYGDAMMNFARSAMAILEEVNPKFQDKLLLTIDKDRVSRFA